MAESSAAESLSLEHLEAYERQLEELNVLLLEDSENQELQAIYEDLAQVIQLIRELQAASPAEPEIHLDAAAHNDAKQSDAQQAHVAAPPISTLLPPQVAEQIRHAQQRAALSGQGPLEWAIGAKCRAVYSGDGNWYDATIADVTADTFFVVFDGYDNKEGVGRDAIQLRTAEHEGGYKGVAAPRRRQVDESAEVPEVPKWLEIKATDDEKTRHKKRKLVKAFKSKARFARLDLQQKQKADAWKRFLAGKPKKSKQKVV